MVVQSGLRFLHLEHVKAKSRSMAMTFEQAIELQRPQTEDIKRILCCRVKGSDATCGALKYANELHSVTLVNRQQQLGNHKQQAAAAAAAEAKQLAAHDAACCAEAARCSR
jgi:hypothetical protein